MHWFGLVWGFIAHSILLMSCPAPQPHSSLLGLDILSSKLVLCVHTLVSNWQLPFLNKWKGENGWWINLNKIFVAGLRLQLRIPGSAVRCDANCTCEHSFLCWGLTSQSTIFQSCRDGATASWVINQYFRGVKCLAQGHNTAAVGFEPLTSYSGVRHSTTEPPRSPMSTVCMVKLYC